jgi:hypothetical protein
LISVIDEIIGTKLTIEIVTAHWTNNWYWISRGQ